MDLIKVAEEAFATGKQHPSFKAGDTVTVAYKIIEGSKERIQLFRGVVIKINGHQDKRRFTVRKMSGTIGVERIFPLESPNIESIEVNKVGKRFVALSCTTCATSPVRLLVSRRSVAVLVLLQSNGSNPYTSIKKRQPNSGLSLFSFGDCLFFLVFQLIVGLRISLSVQCFLKVIPVLKTS